MTTINRWFARYQNWRAAQPAAWSPEALTFFYIGMLCWPNGSMQIAMLLIAVAYRYGPKVVRVA